MVNEPGYGMNIVFKDSIFTFVDFLEKNGECSVNEEKEMRSRLARELRRVRNLRPSDEKKV